ncbi:MAG: peptide ABC transporter substrate-binding protein [Patescibacteria group bacterium]|nr:peptide ABC transporter substrate-binding protein [Patescibacteria group bacterium]
MDFKKVQRVIQKEIFRLKGLEPSDLKREIIIVLKKLPDIVHLKQLVFFSVIFSVVILVLFFQSFSSLKNYYSLAKPSYSGSYTEGIIGEVKGINPIFSIVNPTEDDVVTLVFSGLTKINSKGQVEGDLAEKWQMSPDGKVFQFKLKKNIRWHDGVPLNSDDVIFTINAIQNPDARSPYFYSWRGVQVQKDGSDSVRITLASPLPSFIYNTTVGILPKHLLEKIPAKSLKLAEFNQAPIGSGPYVFSKIEKRKDSSEITLLANDDYYQKKPYIQTVKFKTYKDESSLTNGYLKKEIQGISRISLLNYENALKLKDIKLYIKRPAEYTALFFNEKKEILKDINIRQALAGSVDKGEIVKSLPLGLTVQDGPILAGNLGGLKKKEVTVALADARGLLEKSGWKLGGNVYKKDGVELKLDLVFLDNEEFRKVAEIIKNDWSKLGVNINLKPVSLNDLEKDYIRPRNYDILLVNENVGNANDLYSFWASSEKLDPGLNLSFFENQKVDKYLEFAREAIDEARKAEMLKKAQEILFEEKPAVFLYSSPFIYGVSSEIGGIDIKKIANPKDRFANITDWYVVK